MSETTADSADLAGWRAELLRYVHRLTGDAELAEDVAQDALVKFVSAGGAAAIHSPRAWLYRVATNLVRDGARRSAILHRRPLPIDTDSPATPEQELMRKQTIHSVRAVLDRLSERDRELLILRESGFRYRDIAEVIGVKTESVPKLAIRAMERFRRAYEMEAVHASD